MFRAIYIAMLICIYRIIHKQPENSGQIADTAESDTTSIHAATIAGIGNFHPGPNPSTSK
jgi:hypothetical protein